MIWDLDPIEFKEETRREHKALFARAIKQWGVDSQINKSRSRRRQKAENEKQYMALRHEEPLVPIDNTVYVGEE